MANVTLKMQAAGKNSWDNLVLVIKDAPVSSIIRFNDRNTALEVYRQLTIAHFSDHTGNLEVDIDGKVYDMTPEIWRAVLGTVDQWYEEYMMIVEGVSNF